MANTIITIEDIDRSISDLSYMEATEHLDTFGENTVVDALELLITLKEIVIKRKVDHV